MTQSIVRLHLDLSRAPITRPTPVEKPRKQKAHHGSEGEKQKCANRSWIVPMRLTAQTLI
jgi:hypothetical protein